MKDLKELMAICDEATQGEWDTAKELDGAHSETQTWVVAENTCVAKTTNQERCGSFSGNHEEDAKHIATFNPSTVKALLLRLEKAEAKVKDLIEAGNKLHFLVGNLDFTMWEEDHDPDIDEYAIDKHMEEVLDSWSDKANEQQAKVI